MNQHSNFNRGPTGIGRGVGQTMGGQRQGGQFPSFHPNQYGYDDPNDDDFEDDDFGDVDEHQADDANPYKNTEGNQELNLIEHKMMQDRNFGNPSQRTSQIRGNVDGAVNQPKAGFRAQNYH